MALLTIQSAQENQWVFQNLVKGRYSNDHVWLDATRQAGGKWRFNRVDTIHIAIVKDLHLYLNRCSLWICGMKDVHLN